tara:strand:- start:113975 stop:114979 length:1005 start_codon:yes stop_codon:yes gene_type:complete
MILIMGVAGLMAFKGGAFGGGGLQVWHYLGPLQTIDANDDGFADPLGFAMHVSARDEYTTLMAVSGKDGSVLWESKSFGKLGNVASARIITTKNALFVAQDAGRLRGFNKNTGEATWATQLPEKADRFCPGSDASHVVIETAGDEWLTLNTGDGSLSQHEPAMDCLPLTALTMEYPEGNTKGVSEYEEYEKLSEMRVHHVFQWVGSDVAIAFGSRAKGTDVPMIGAYRIADNQPLWTSEVPARNPLSARTGAPNGQINAEVAAVVYEQNDVPRISVFRIADGTRLWDIAVPQRWGVAGLAIDNDRLFVSSAGLYSFDLATGALKFVTAATTNPR